jgi:hypothetical protein
MIPHLRKLFNESFTEEKYQSFLNDLDKKHPGAIEFRVAETPVFVPQDFKEKMISACESIVDIILAPGFAEASEKAIPSNDFIPGKELHPQFIAFDFGVCLGNDNTLEPKLIEMQGFPTLYAFQVFYPETIQKNFPVTSGLTQYLGGYNRESYLKDLGDILLNGEPAEHTILLEIKPHEQKTKVDFYCTQDYFGIQPVCITELFAEGKKLFYCTVIKKRKHG